MSSSARPLHAVLGQKSVEDEPMQGVDLEPRQRAAADPLHRRPIAGAPGVGEARPIDASIRALAPKAVTSRMMLPRQSTTVPNTSNARAFTVPSSGCVDMHLCPWRSRASRSRRRPRVTLTAQYLNSGILPNGSSTGFVSRFAAAS